MRGSASLQPRPPDLAETIGEALGALRNGTPPDGLPRYQPPGSYDVYRSTMSGGPYSLITNVPGSTTSTTDGTVAANTTYYYVLKSGFGSFRSANSNQKSVATGVCV